MTSSDVIKYHISIGILTCFSCHTKSVYVLYVHGQQSYFHCEACHVSRLSSRSFSHWTAAWLVAAGFRSGAAQAGLSAPGRKWELLCPRTHFYEVNTLNTEHGTRNTVVCNPAFLTFHFIFIVYEHWLCCRVFIHAENTQTGQSSDGDRNDNGIFTLSKNI